MTQRNRKLTWLAGMLAVVFAWGVPAEAGPRGKRDEALAQHLKAAPRAEYRVIIETVDHNAQTGEKVLRVAGGRKLRRLLAFPGTVVVVTARQLEQLERHPLVKAVYLDRPTSGQLSRTTVTTGASAARAFLRYTGEGVGVAVIDSGITGWHDDLSTAGAGQRVSAFVDFVQGQTAAYDDYGHGTHVAGIIAGNGYDSYGKHTGIAPNASVVALKVLDGAGNGYMSDVIAAIDWAVENRVAQNIRVINLSVGAPITQSYMTDPLTLAAKRAVDVGIVVVAAAGNRGKNAAGQIQYGGITAPGNAPWVITVGNANSQGTVARWDDTIANSSSRGPTPIDFGAKPDLVAPGTGIVSLNSTGSTLSQMHPAALYDGARLTDGPEYISMSGTSMAAPVVSGTVALMLQANPTLSPNLVKAILQYTSHYKPAIRRLDQGTGFLNTLGAVYLSHYFATNADANYYQSPLWSKTIIWGNRIASGGTLVATADAWGDNIVWGTLSDGDNIVWGTLADGDNIVWGTLAGDGDNIVWGTAEDAGDNIVWGTDCGGVDCGDGVVWGTLTGDGDNIVWGTAMDGDNIVWGTAMDGDNIVWGTAEDGDNIVWGTAADGDNIVWGTAADGDNIVWGTSDLIETFGTDNPAEAAETVFDDLFAPPPPPPAPVVTDPTGITGGTL